MAAARSYAAKRKAPSSQPGGMGNANGNGRGSPGAFSFGSGVAGPSSSGAESSTHRTLFSSILAPPGPTVARTILNANDPPVAAPIRPAMSPKVRNAKVVRSIAESTRAQAKSRRQPKDKGKTGGRSSRKAAAATATDADGDVDMEAAATLTSLLLNHRPSIAGSDTSEPGIHSAHSQAQSLPGRSYPHPHPPSSTASLNASNNTSYRSNTPPRTSNNSNTPNVGQTTPRPAPTDNEAADLMLYLATSPSPARPGGSKNARDAAAFRALGNPNTANPNANGNNVMRAKPRVLFPTTQTQSSGEPNNSPDDSNLGSGRRGSRAGLGRNDSFAGSSMSSIGSEMGVRGFDNRDRDRDRDRDRNSSTSQQQQQLLPPSPAHLLPPPSLPPHSHSHSYSQPQSHSQGGGIQHQQNQQQFTSSPSSLRQESSSSSSPRPMNTGDRGNGEFNFNEYIHASPTRYGASGSGPGSSSMPIHTHPHNSHHAHTHAPLHVLGQGHPNALPFSHGSSLASGSTSNSNSTSQSQLQQQKSNLGLRADVGRKLFEEEQIRLQQHQQYQQQQTQQKPQAPRQRRTDDRDRSLEAGIDLVRT